MASKTRWGKWRVAVVKHVMKPKCLGLRPKPNSTNIGMDKLHGMNREQNGPVQRNPWSLRPGKLKKPAKIQWLHAAKESLCCVPERRIFVQSKAWIDGSRGDTSSNNMLTTPIGDQILNGIFHFNWLFHWSFRGSPFFGSVRHRRRFEDSHRSSRVTLQSA